MHSKSTQRLPNKVSFDRFPVNFMRFIFGEIVTPFVNCLLLV